MPHHISNTTSNSQGYEPATYGDGGHGQFGARSPNEWRQPGTGPINEVSYNGAATGDEEPWNSEAVSTVSIDLSQCASALETFTAEAADYKINEFGKTNPKDWVDAKSAKEKLIKMMGYDEFMNANMKQLGKVWDPPPPPPAKEAAPAAAKAAAPKKE